MPVEITARHMHAGAALQEYARNKAAQLIEDFPRIEHVHVVLDVQKHDSIAEVVVQAKNHIRLEASESSAQMRMSIDTAVEKVERQLRRLRDKVQDRKQTMKHVRMGRERESE
jgi:putative sigma-54 modulation protein